MHILLCFCLLCMPTVTDSFSINGPSFNRSILYKSSLGPYRMDHLTFGSWMDKGILSINVGFVNFKELFCCVFYCGPCFIIFFVFFYSIFLVFMIKTQFYLIHFFLLLWYFHFCSTITIRLTNTPGRKSSCLHLCHG
jgi:hypothetical protein